MIIKTFDLEEFKKEFVKREFENYGRGSQFSEEALEELFNYYDRFDEPFEMNVIAICCDWAEYESLDDYAAEYINGEELEGLAESEKEERILEELSSKTYYIRLSNGGVLVANY